ncbi:hypothetical protein [Micromonospora viridifaciens]|uniref:hypothetical protein n=1 Tax=Micromonospora viridifaciens TaxID=1881 RepID=UPI000B5AE5CA|nr:hypothetical protein [Micromonospora viridifaciens]
MTGVGAGDSVVGKAGVRADRVAADFPGSAWQRRSAGAGSKGPRFYDWAWLDDVTTDDGGHHSLLSRRNTTTVSWLSTAAGPHARPPSRSACESLDRWTVEESVQAAKSQAGLDQHVRRWDSWHRSTTLALAAPGDLRRQRRRARTRPGPAHRRQG